MKRTIESKFITGKELDKIGETQEVKFQEMRGDLQDIRIGKEGYILQRCGGKEERYKVLKFYEIKI